MAKLLIVEDEEAMRDLLRQRLEDKYEVIETGDASEALALTLQQKPDGVLLDLMMPKFTGFELCRVCTCRVPPFGVGGVFGVLRVSCYQ